MTVINKTPHPVNIISNDKEIRIMPTLPPARVAETSENVEVIEVSGVNVQVTKKVYGMVENLPDPEDDVVYLVSAIVASRVPDRADVYVPSNPVRNAEGSIIGCKEFSHI